jgi:hypothetical protein
VRAAGKVRHRPSRFRSAEHLDADQQGDDVYVPLQLRNRTGTFGPMGIVLQAPADSERRAVFETRRDHDATAADLPQWTRRVGPTAAPEAMAVR